MTANFGFGAAGCSPPKKTRHPDLLWTMNAALLKAARELLYQASLLVAAMESSQREAAVGALVKIETLARGLRSAIEEQ